MFIIMWKKIYCVSKYVGIFCWGKDTNSAENNVKRMQITDSKRHVIMGNGELWSAMHAVKRIMQDLMWKFIPIHFQCTDGNVLIVCRILLNSKKSSKGVISIFTGI